jgi:hypothetical protein
VAHVEVVCMPIHYGEGIQPKNWSESASLTLRRGHRYSLEFTIAVRAWTAGFAQTASWGTIKNLTEASITW